VSYFLSQVICDFTHHRPNRFQGIRSIAQPLPDKQNYCASRFSAERTVQLGTDWAFNVPLLFDTSSVRWHEI